MTKGQIVTHFAGKFEISKKVAGSMIEEYAALAIAETKKKGAFVLPGLGNPSSLKEKPVKVGTRNWERNQDPGEDGREDKTG